MAQFARPSSTVDAGGWTYLVASLHEDTNEVIPNGDTDYAEAETTDTIMKLALSSVADPTVGTGHTLRFTAEALNGGGGGEKLDVYLYEGTSLIVKAFSKQGINRDAYQLYEYTLSEVEANSINNYTDLRAWFEVDNLNGAELIRITQIEFEVPDVAGNQWQRLVADDVGITDGLTNIK
ncbi:hypothetical protein LCGC14_2578030, partial [marine sediment metagenome]